MLEVLQSLTVHHGRTTIYIELQLVTAQQTPFHYQPTAQAHSPNTVAVVVWYGHQVTAQQEEETILYSIG